VERRFLPASGPQEYNGTATKRNTS
jgi:hypothetical protein